jgi:hypothetical protein
MSVLFVPVLLLFCFGVGRYELNPVLRYSLAAAGSMLLAGISAFFTLMDGRLIPELAIAALVAAPVIGCLVAAGSHAMAEREAEEDEQRMASSGYRPLGPTHPMRDAPGAGVAAEAADRVDASRSA